MSQFLKISTYLSSSYLHTCLIGSVSLKNTDYYIRQSTKLISSKFGCQCVWTTWKGWTITRNAGNCDIDILNSYRIPSEFIQPSTWSNKLFFSIGVKSIHLKASFLPSCLPEVKATYYRHWKLNRNTNLMAFCAKNDDCIPKPTECFVWFSSHGDVLRNAISPYFTGFPLWPK